VRTIPSIEHGVRPESLERFVSRAARRGGWVPLVFHRIVPGDRIYELSPEVFERFVDWMVEGQRRVLVKTVAEVIAG
jgi:hypothetical protein